MKVATENTKLVDAVNTMSLEAENESEKDDKGLTDVVEEGADVINTAVEQVTGIFTNPIGVIGCIFFLIICAVFGYFALNSKGGQQAMTKNPKLQIARNAVPVVYN